MNEKPLEFDEAFARIMSISIEPRIETCCLHDASHRIVAVNAAAQVDMPPFLRAMMDGYAIRAADVAGPDTVLKVVAQVGAGYGQAVFVGPSQAVRIATGAPVPEGADSVARFEWVREAEAEGIRVIHPMRPGESVQPQGQDGKAGNVIVRAGQRLTGARMMVCKAFGVREVQVTIPPSVAIIMTGSELSTRTEQPLGPGQIYASTDAYLVDAMEQDGARVVLVQHVRDNRDEIREAIVRAAAQADYVFLTGGVSAGDFDFVPGILNELSDPLVRRVLMRPGAPFVAARLNQATVFAMSGNPAAGLIQFEVFVRPAVRHTLGIVDKPFAASGKLAADVALKPMKHVRILRGHAVTENGEVRVDTQMAQSPGAVSGFARANCLVRMDVDEAIAGTVVPLRLLDPPELAGQS